MGDMFVTTRPGSRKGSGGFRLDANPVDCLKWGENLNSAGYGRMWVYVEGIGRRQRYVHREAWEVTYGEIPEGMEIDHLCCTRSCYLLDHLELVTRSENIRRANSRVTHCPQGHEYTKENTAKYGENGRVCRSCHRDRSSAYAKLKVESWPLGVRRKKAWVDILELSAQGYSILRISNITGVARETIRRLLPEYRRAIPTHLEGREQ